jgi:hypothetical protein
MKPYIFILNRSLIKVICLFSLLQIFGCCSNEGALSFSSLEYPVSMSAFLYDQNNQVVMKGKELETVNNFEFSKTYWSLAYGLIPLTKGESISDTLNAIIDRNHGDGIINLTIGIEQGIVNKVYSFFMYLPSYIPFLPSSANIKVSGEVVTMKLPAEPF